MRSIYGGTRNDGLSDRWAHSAFRLPRDMGKEVASSHHLVPLMVDNKNHFFYTTSVKENID